MPKLLAHLRSCLLGFALAALPVLAHAQQAMETAEAGFDTCLASFTQPATTIAALKAQGWRYEGALDGYQWLSRNNRNSIVATGGKSGRLTGCFASAASLSTKQATAFATRIAEKLDLTRTEVADAPIGNIWVGTLGGRKVALNVLTTQQYEYHIGAAVLLIAE